MKKAHLLTKNKGEEFPEDFIFFDTETFEVPLSEDLVEHKFRLGVALYWRTNVKDSQDILQWLKFTDPGVFWDFVVEKALAKRRLILMAHNIQYDMKVLKGFERLKNRNWKLTKMISEHFVNIWKFKKGTKTLMFVDTMNFFNLSLKRLGKDIGLEKFEMPEKESTANFWFCYCQRDVEIIYQAVKQWLIFIKENRLGCFSPTLASQSFNAYRHRFMSVPIFIHNNKTVTQLERESYHGGRTECFFIGKLPEKNYYNLDVNSMYPAVMKKNLYPTKLVSLIKPQSISELKKLLADYCLVARVKIKTQQPVFPYLKDNKLCFPIGEFETVLTSRELEYALSKNYIREVKETALYLKAKLFEDYVDFFYHQRRQYLKEQNFSFGFISKLFLNSLYGKWGQRNDVWEVVAENTGLPDCCYNEWDVDDRILNKFRVISGILEKSVGKVEAVHSFPAIASHITADSRMLLWNYIESAGRENVYYCDTDSLFVNKKALTNLKSFLSSFRLGFLKLKDQTQNLIIKGLKDYQFGSKLTLKGIKPEAKKIKDNTFLQWQWEGLRGSIHQNRMNTMVLKKVVKVLNRKYNKGKVLNNGTVIPFQISSKEDNFTPKETGKIVS